MTQQHIDDLRGHDFLPADLSAIPALYSEDRSADDTAIHLRFFTNVGSAFWLLAQYDPTTEIAFGYAEVIPGLGEWGSFSLRELRELYVIKHGIPIVVERDLHWVPKRFSEVKFL